MQKIGVFLASQANLQASFLAATRAVGEWLGKTNRTLVYGGAHCGLMQVLATTVKAHGGRLFGVVPQIVYERNQVCPFLDVEFRTVDLHDRKSILMRESDILVALPGGIGTLDEAFTVMAANSIGTAHKPIVFYDVEGCWQPLLQMLEHLEQLGLVSNHWKQQVRVVRSIEELENLIASLTTAFPK